ncbi:hypothetical protein Ct61P_12053 [Colletotrichum tofieldiae]|nr:hypothetical protein Ct61P_12053 [Colletotrichum tofieldiae]
MHVVQLSGGLGMLTNLKAGSRPKKATKTMKEMPSTKRATFLKAPMMNEFQAAVTFRGSYLIREETADEVWLSGVLVVDRLKRAVQKEAQVRAGSSERIKPEVSVKAHRVA